jgi:hypothetical protein
MGGQLTKMKCTSTPPQTEPGLAHDKCITFSNFNFITAGECDGKVQCIW